MNNVKCTNISMGWSSTFYNVNPNDVKVLFRQLFPGCKLLLEDLDTFVIYVDDGKHIDTLVKEK